MAKKMEPRKQNNNKEIKTNKHQGTHELGYLDIHKHEQQLADSQEQVNQTNEELEVKLAEIFFIHEFLKALATTVSVDDVTKLTADGVSGILGIEISAVYLYDMKTQKLTLKAWHGEDKKYLKNKFNLEEDIVGMAAANKHLIRLGDGNSQDAKGFLTKKQDPFIQIATPLQVVGRVLGVVAIASCPEREFNEDDDRRIINITNMSSIALQNAIFHDDLQKLSITDPLTGLYNRGYLDSRIKEELERAKRYNRLLSFVMFDLDKFKDFNDSFGHLKGDVLLQKVTKIIKNNVRSSDVVARYGGEEFVVILPETSAKDALAQAEKIRKIIEKTKFKGNKDNPVVSKTISAGISSFPKDGDTKNVLIEKADTALYKAKSKGRNKVISF